MRTHSILLFLLLGAGSSYAQQVAPCAPVANKPYHPLPAGSINRFQVVGGPVYTMSLSAKPTKLEGKEYLEQTVDYGTAKTVAYYRQEGSATVYRATPEAAETTEIPATPVSGAVWYEADSTWRYTVLSTGEDFTSPTCRYTGCLHIQSEQLVKGEAGRKVQAVYQQYFQRGRGYVGTVMAGKVVTYRLD